MSRVTVELTKQTVAMLDTLRKRWGSAALRKELVDFFDVQAQVIAGNITTKYLSGGAGLQRRTGTLARSTVGVGFNFAAAPGLKVGLLRGPALRYARVHEFGTVGKGGLLPTIRPRRAKALAMPTRDGGALTPAGAERYNGPRNFPQKLVFIKFRSKGNVIGGLFKASDLKKLGKARKAVRKGKPGKRMPTGTLRDLVAVYLLLRKADIRPTQFLQRGFLEYLPTLMVKLGERLRRAVAGA